MIIVNCKRMKAKRNRIQFCLLNAALLAIFQVEAQPVITLQLTNQRVIAGSNAIFSVSVSGTGPFTYQWQFNGSNLEGPRIITTAAGNGSFGFSGDGGAATNAEFSSPDGVTVDNIGNLFIADSQNERIREIDTNGIITTMAGNGSYGYSEDGIPATNATVYFPTSVALDSAGNLFIVCEGSDRICKVGTNGIITKVAGGGYSYPGDGGPANNAELSIPYGVAVDSANNLFIAEYGSQRIQKVDTNGIITTVAGNGSFGFFGDGGAATDAELSFPRSVAVDSAGNLFIADSQNCCIRKVDTNGIITTVAGNGSLGFFGDGGAATNANLSKPYGVSADGAGNLFIADYNNQRIREINTNGIITTVAGNGTVGFSGDGGAAIDAALDWPTGVALDNAGNLFIADQGSQHIRKVWSMNQPTLTLPHLTTTNIGNYSVVITSPSGSITSCVVRLVVLLPPQSFFLSSIIDNQITFQFNGTPSYPYILQSAANLTPPINWQPVITNSTDANGNWNITITNSSSMPFCFFRAVGQ